MASQRIMEPQLLNLPLGGALQKPTDECDPHAADEVAGKYSPYAEEDEQIGDESPYIGSDESGSAHAVSGTPDNGPKNAAPIQREARNEIEQTQCTVDIE